MSDLIPLNANLSLNSSDLELPQNFLYMSPLSTTCVIIYSILFLISSFGNISVFFSILKQMRHSKSRISLLIFHLCTADLIVTFTAMPLEILWRITIQWYGGDFLCKLCQFLRAFGLYLSSMVVICISLDRYFAIIHPLRLARAAERARLTLLFAWIFAFICASPQAILFRVNEHPIYRNFKQCVTETFLRSDLEQELVYNLFSVSVLYFLPLLVILYTYFRILWKIFNKSRLRKRESVEGSGQELGSGKVSSVAVSYSLANPGYKNTDVRLSNDEKGRVSLPTLVDEKVAEEASTPRLKPLLRTSVSGGVLMARARVRTLRMTCIIVLTFVLCWTPYVVMTLWYMIDRSGAQGVDIRIQEGLFLMAVSNSVMNPLIYGTYGSSECQRKCCVRSNSRYGGHYYSPNPKGREVLNSPRKSVISGCGQGVTITSLIMQNGNGNMPSPPKGKKGSVSISVI